MKINIVLDLQCVGEATRIAGASDDIMKHDRKFESPKGRRELLAIFNADADEFKRFVYAAFVAARVAGRIHASSFEELS